MSMFNFIYFQEKIFASVLDGVELSENETIALASVEYLEELDNLIGRTPNSVLKNFMVWRIVDTFSELLGVDKDYRNDTRPRSHRCFNFAAYNLHLSINANWVRHFVKQQTKNEVAKIIDSIKQEFKEILKNLAWLDEETRVRALSKLMKMTPFVAYPDELLNETALLKTYENISIDESKFFETVLDLNKFYLYATFKDLHKPIDRNNWEVHSHVSVVNAFYSPPENTIRKSVVPVQNLF